MRMVCKKIESCAYLVNEYVYRNACIGDLKLALCPVITRKLDKLPIDHHRSEQRSNQTVAKGGDQ